MAKKITRPLQNDGFGQRLLQARKRMHVTQEQLAHLVDVSSRTYIRWEKDQAFPQPHYHQRLCAVLHVSPEDLFGEGVRRLWSVPHQRNLYFTGREDLLASLHSTLTSQKMAALTALSGLGGIGKTQVALEYAFRYADEYDVVVWINSDNQQSLVTDFLQLAELLQLIDEDESGEQIDRQQRVKLVVRWLQQTPQRWLLILDNVEDQALVKAYLPTRSSGHVLLTTRLQSVSASVQTIEVNTLERQQATLLLLRRATLLPNAASLDQADEQTRQAAESIVDALGALPLALDQAGAFIEETQCSLADYLHMYQTCRAELLQQPSPGSSQNSRSVVATTWNLSFEKVAKANPAAADLLRLCSFLHPDDIPESLLSSGAAALGPVLQTLVTDTLLWNKAIGTLRTASLVRRTVETRQITIHRLVQAVLKDAMDCATYRTWAERVVRMAELAFPEIKFEASSWAAQWPICQRYLPHVLLCANLIEHEQLVFPEAGHLLVRAARYLSNQGQLGKAKPLYWQALAIFEHLPDQPHPDSPTCLHNLGLIHFEQGQFHEAEQLFQRALDASEQAFGTANPYTAKCLNSLAMLYHDSAQYALAQSFYQRALSILQQQPEPQHIATSGALNNLAEIYCLLAQYELAEPLFQQALTIYTQILGPDHPYTAEVQCNLAELYRAQGQYSQAEPFIQRAVTILQKQLGPAHQRTLRNLTSLALLHRDQAQYDQSESLFNLILSAWAQRQDAAYSPDTARSLHGLATLFLQQRRYEEAQPLLTRALDLRRQALGSDHPETAESLHSLALLYRDQQQYELAEPLFQQALTIRQQIFGAAHPQTAHSLNDLAILHQRQQQDQQPARHTTNNKSAQSIQAPG